MYDQLLEFDLLSLIDAMIMVTIQYPYPTDLPNYAEHQAQAGGSPLLQ